MNLIKERRVGDGVGEKKKIAYSFQSEYGEEAAVANLVSRKRIKPMSAVHQCIVEFDLEADGEKDFSWLVLKPWQKDTFLELKLI